MSTTSTPNQESLVAVTAALQAQERSLFALHADPAVRKSLVIAGLCLHAFVGLAPITLRNWIFSNADMRRFDDVEDEHGALGS